MPVAVVDRLVPLLLLIAVGSAAEATAATRIRIMPPDRATFAVGQRFDLRVEATGDAAAPTGLRVFVGETEVTSRNVLDPGPSGVRGEGGTGAAADPVPPYARAQKAGSTSSNFLLRGYAFSRPGPYLIRASTADGAQARVTVEAQAWQGARAGAERARNIIFLLGDGMGAAHRTAARLMSRGIRDGKAVRPLAMDTLEITGLVQTPSLNAAITDSAPGMASYSTGHKANNNQEGVYPDNTDEPFDNPRVEYIGEFLRRTRGPGFGVGIVTTADVTDATPAANAVHTANRSAGPRIAAQFFDERESNGVRVLMGGGARHFRPKGHGSGERPDARDLFAEFARAGYTTLATATDVTRQLAAPAVPARLLGLFHPTHLAVAFDKVGADRYSRELALEKHAGLRDQPMLDQLTRLALRSLSAHSPAGFYLMVEGASIDKQAHAVDAERTVWDTIEFDNAVQVALEFADRTNNDGIAGNDTLVIVTADHECGGMAIVGVGNERYAPQRLGRAVRDYAAVFRFQPLQILDFVPNYEVDADGFPIEPDPSRKLLLGWAAAPDRYENWLSNRLAQDAAISGAAATTPTGRATRAAVANPARDGAGAGSDNATVAGQAIAGFHVPGVIENGELACRGEPECPGDVSSDGHTIAGHTAADVPLSATGPGALQFTGSYENTDVFIRMLRAAAGSYPPHPMRPRSRR